MSEIRVENIIGETGTDAVNFTKGINVTGIVTATNVSIGSSVTATNFFGSGAGLSGVSAGKILQVKQTFVNSAVSINGVSSYADISGFNISITPSSASNKILVMVQMNVSSEGEYILKLVRTAGGSTSDIGNSTAGYYTSFTGGFHNTARSGYYDLMDKNFNFLDDAQDTNAHVYKVQWSNITNVFTCINRTAYHTSVVNYSYSGSSTITAMEIEA